MTVSELAVQLGVTEREAMALCIASGIKVTSPSSRLSERDQFRIHQVLTGQARLRDPKAVTGASVKRGGGAKLGLIGGLIAFALLAVGCMTIVGLGSLRGETSINVSPGQCFDATVFVGTVFGNEINPKPCDDAQYRAFAVLDLQPIFTEFPGRDKLQERAEERCLAIAPSSVRSDDMFVPIYYFGPADATAWENPAARKIVCAEPTDGSGGMGIPFGF